MHIICHPHTRIDTRSSRPFVGNRYAASHTSGQRGRLTNGKDGFFCAFGETRRGGSAMTSGCLVAPKYDGFRSRKSGSVNSFANVQRISHAPGQPTGGCPSPISRKTRKMRHCRYYQVNFTHFHLERSSFFSIGRSSGPRPDFMTIGTKSWRVDSCRREEVLLSPAAPRAGLLSRAYEPHIRPGYVTLMRCYVRNEVTA